MAIYEVFQNGVISKTNEPVYQIGIKYGDGTYTVIVPKIMTKAEAEAELDSIMGKPAIIAETVAVESEEINGKVSSVSAPSYDYEPPKKKKATKTKKAK